MLSWYYTDYAGNKLDLKSDASKMSERNIDFKKFVKLYSKLPNDKRHDLIKVLGSKRQNNGRDINLCSRVHGLEMLLLHREALNKLHSLWPLHKLGSERGEEKRTKYHCFQQAEPNDLLCFSCPKRKKFSWLTTELLSTWLSSPN